MECLDKPAALTRSGVGWRTGAGLHRCGGSDKLLCQGQAKGIAVFGINYLKSGPTTYILQYSNGKLVREGAGLSFFYYAPTALLVRVPISTVDVPFAFEDVSADYQGVSLQGQLTYRVSDPKKLASLLDFSISPSGRYNSDDPQKLNERLITTVQELCAAQVHQLPLRDLLTAQRTMSEQVLQQLRASPQVTMLGLEILSLSIMSIRPNPETAKALEAEARELLLRQADEAIYARRNAAVEQERKIKESELNTELAVQEKQRQIRQKEIAASIEAERQRQELIATKVENERKQADAQAYALDATLRPLRETDWRVILAASASKIDPRTSIAMAFREMAENAGKIGELNISPDLLAELTKDDSKRK